jgi:hypothetical protein
MKCVLRETKESRRWLKFISACQLQNQDELDNLPDEARQLAAIFAAIVRNTQNRVAQEKVNAEKRRR